MKLKKPRFWDYKKPNLLSYILLPFTIPLIISKFFLNLKKKNNIKIKKKKICVGNIYIGGTAKTPLTLKIYKILDNLNFKTATIKKFYKDQIDEQKILFKQTRLYCSKSRNTALNEAIKDDMEFVIFDDGLQDRSIDYDFKFVCFNNSKWIGNGFLIPAGPLREKVDSLLKFDAAFINGNEADNSKLKTLIKDYNKNIQIFESYYKATNIDKFNFDDKYIIFSGIGNPDSFKETLIRYNFKIVKEITFPDHYEYCSNDIKKIKLDAKNLGAKILTTEKDHIRIGALKNNDIDFLKIELVIKNEEKLIKYLNLNK